jgi:hypothetical protein
VAIITPLTTGRSRQLPGCPSQVAEWLTTHPQGSGAERIYGVEDHLDASPVAVDVGRPAAPKNSAGWGAEVVLTGIIELDSTVSAPEVAYIRVFGGAQRPPPTDPFRREPYNAVLHNAPTKETATKAFRMAAVQLLKESRIAPARFEGQAVRTLLCMPLRYPVSVFIR